MFNAVTDSAGGLELLPKDVYIVKVIKFEPSESSKYGNPQVKWVFHVADKNGKPVLRPDGQPVEVWEYTTKNITSHPKNKPRPWFSALLGRDVKAGEGGGALVSEALNKKAMAFIDQYKTETGRDRNRITSMWPIGGAAPSQDELLFASPDQYEIPF